MGFERIRQLFELKRLLQDRPVGIILRDAARSVSRREDERAAPRGEKIGDRVYFFVAEIDVEQSQIDVGRGKIILRLGDMRKGCRNRKTELFEHIGEQHSDERFVFDDENAGLWRAAA